MKKIKIFLRLIRIKHYIKNFLIFVPLLFAKQLFEKNFLSVVYGFFAFSFLASAIYIINDLKDIEKDKEHPTKKNRPIASGLVSKKIAIIITCIMITLSFILNSFAANSIQSYVFLLIYFLLNLGYTLILKNVAIIDIFLLMIFYIIRIYYGAIIVDVAVSNWLYLTIMSSSFFLAFGKRRNEIIKMKNKTRNVLQFYNHEFLDKFMYLSLTLTIVFYSLWAIDQEIDYLVLSIPLVFLIFMKYSLTVEGNSDGDPTEVLMNDKILLGLCVIYFIIMTLIYGVLA